MAQAQRVTAGRGRGPIGVLLLTVSACCLSVAAPAAGQRDARTRGDASETLRVDYYHGGTATTEFFALGRLSASPGWAGAIGAAADDLGTYRVSLVDRTSDEILYSRGYCTIFGEWQTTADARKRTRVFEECVTLPMPSGPARVEIARRDRLGRFVTQQRFDVAPRGRDVHRHAARPRSTPEVVHYRRSGDPAVKVDLAVVAEGYRATELDRFKRDAAALVDALFAIEPFRTRRDDFNVAFVCAASEESGLDRPRQRTFVRSAVESTFDALGIGRYILAEDQGRVTDVASAVPHDLIAIVVNTTSYGGGGIYNWQLTCGARDARARHVFAHEFGHLLGGLADEYYQSAVTYENIYPDGVEPWEPNITRLLEPSKLKWRALVETRTPLPTPWSKEAYDDPRTRDRGRLLRDDPHFGRVGAFEGAGYAREGLFRPSLSCIMFSASAEAYCPVCQRALGRAIDRLTGRPARRAEDR